MSVSVIIPNYNNAPFLERCLTSVVDDPAVCEVLVYDNASTDASISTLERLAHSKVRIIVGDRNIGASRARHCAVAEAKAPYLAFLDGDDFFEELTLSRCLERAIAEDLDICGVQTMLVDVDAGQRRAFVPAPSAMDGQAAVLKTLGGWQFDPGSGIIRKEIYQKAVEGFTFYGYSDDELLSRRMVRVARRISGAEGTYFYRLGPRQPSNEQIAMRLITHVRSLALASDSPGANAHALLSASRRHVLRTLAVLSMKKSDHKSLLALRQACKETGELAIPWRVADLPYRFAMVVAGRILAART
ncbi:MAG TPA: glycosyltransferase family 2 protein [Sphingomicrobium sp.]|nr:glycosyltransferase family 2 protein [Sphingomicrobium sp.]